MKREMIMNEAQTVEKMIELIRANGGENAATDSRDGGANYMLGYLGSTIVSLATKYPEVLEEVNSTIDWLEASRVKH